MEYYWHIRTNPPPPPIRDPSEFRDTERLTIACTQTGLTASKQRALVKDWCRLLPSLAVKTLWLSSKVPQNLFDAACAMPTLEGLWIKWSGNGIRDIGALRQARLLKYFHLGSSTSLADITPLGEMRQLRWLLLESLTKVSDVARIGTLTDLEGLGLVGSMWTTWQIDSLAPVAQLKKLRFLSFVNLRAKSKTLAPLYELTRLETLQLAQWWNPLEVIEIQNRNPGLAA